MTESSYSSLQRSVFYRSQLDSTLEDPWIWGLILKKSQIKLPNVHHAKFAASLIFLFPVLPAPPPANVCSHVLSKKSYDHRRYPDLLTFLFYSFRVKSTDAPCTHPELIMGFCLASQLWLAGYGKFGFKV